MTKVDFVKLATEPHTTCELINDVRVAIAEASPGDIPGVLRNLAEMHGGRFALDRDKPGQPRKWEFLMDEVCALERRGRSRQDAASIVARNHDPANAKAIRQALISY